jgi:hypothetical protein
MDLLPYEFVKLIKAVERNPSKYGLTIEKLGEEKVIILGKKGFRRILDDIVNALLTTKDHCISVSRIRKDGRASYIPMEIIREYCKGRVREGSLAEDNSDIGGVQYFENRFGEFWRRY